MQYFLPPKNALMPHFYRFFIFLLLSIILHVSKLTLVAVLMLCAAFAGLIYMALRISFSYMYIKGERLVIKSGIFTKRTSAFSNVRLIYIKQSSPVAERFFKISNISLHGYGTHYFFFPLSQQDADSLINLCGVLNDNL